MKQLIWQLFKQKYLLFSLLIACWAGLALLHPGLPPTHDGEYHIIRFYEFDKVLKDGSIYPRWAPDLNFGYGVPLFTYVYPLPNYVASFFHFFGISFIDAFKLQMFVAVLVGGLFFYLFVKDIFGEQGGLVSSAFYSFSPYHFVDIYIRGSVGEVLAIGLFPLWLWSYTRFVRTQKISYFLCSILSLSLIILAHNILALMFFVFILFFMVFHIVQSKIKQRLFFNSILIIVLSLGTTAIFWLPALLETSLVSGLQIYNIQKNFPDLFQLLFPSWGTGFFDENLVNQMSVQIGTANLFAVIVCIILFLKHFKDKKIPFAILGFFLTAFCATFFLITPYSLPVWKIVPLLHYFQFPWRLLSLMIIICSFLAGCFFYKKRSILWIILFLSILFLTTYDYDHPAFYHLRNDLYYTSRSNFIDGTNSPGNAFQTIWTPVFTKKAKEKASIIKGEGIIIEKKETPTQQLFFATMTTPSQVLFSTSYFPSWKATINNKETIIKNDQGLLSLILPKGAATILLTASTTAIETIALWITTFSIIFLLVIRVFSVFVRKFLKIL